MNITLSEDEAATLRELLRDSLPGLKFEVARTHGKELRLALEKRQTLCEWLLDELERQR